MLYLPIKSGQSCFAEAVPRKRIEGNSIFRRTNSFIDTTPSFLPNGPKIQLHEPKYRAILPGDMRCFGLGTDGLGHGDTGAASGRAGSDFL